MAGSYLFFLVTVFLGSFLTKAVISSSPGELFFGESPKYQNYINRNMVFGGDNIALIAFEGDDLFSVRNIEGLNSITDILEVDEEIERVDSLATALAADLFLVPALVKLGWMKFNSR
jgi:predicted RND superfamily exporter protein